MEFWGVEVKAKDNFKVTPKEGKLIHISQAAIGELKDVKGPKNVPLRMITDDKNYIIGTLSIEGRPHLMFDLVFENEFVLSHGLEKGSVYFMGYIADNPVSEDDAFVDDDGEGEEESSDEEAVPIEGKENGTIKVKAEDVKPKVKAEDVKPAAGKEKKEEKVAKKEVEEDSDDSDFDSDDEMAVDGLQVDSSDISGDDSDEEGEDDSSEEEEEELPKELPKGKQAKKRQAEPAEKIPAAKKAKAATPEKTGKKGQNPTPDPSKSAGKTPKLNQQTPKSGGQASGKPFNKTHLFG